MAGTHKELTASHAAIWINCSGSVREIAAMPEDLRRGRSSRYADEGTAAHAVLRYCLTPLLTLQPPISPYNLIGGWVNHLTEEVLRPEEVSEGAMSSIGIVHGWWEITPDMAEAVNTGVEEAVAIINRLGGGCELQLENTWDLSWLHPKMGGTSDFKASIFLDELVVMDYKHGKGVVVEIDEYEFDLGGGVILIGNPQLLIYMLGAAKEDRFSHDKYTAVICQPRAPHAEGPIRSKTYSRAEIMAFYLFIKQKAYATEDPKALLHSGRWCRWCPKSGDCAEQDRATSAAIGVCFDDLPPEDGTALAVPEDLALIAQKLKWLPFINTWAKAVEGVALRAAMSGLTVPERKLVEGKSNRKLRDDGTPLVQAIAAKGLDDSQIWEPSKLKSASQLEKLGKPYKALVNAKDDSGEFLYTFKPRGKLILADINDKRPAVDPAAFSEFTDLDEEEDES